MKRLIVLGDSFSAPPKIGDDYEPWYLQTAKLLGMNCENHSMIGVSQDWCFWMLSKLLKDITPEDQILIVLTHPGRFWFFDDKPQMTNPNIVNIDKELTSTQLEAVKNFMLEIQRPPLDLQLQSHRLGWLDAQIRLHKLKPAHVLCAFPLYIELKGYDMSEHINWNDYENVLISKGNLMMNVEVQEMKLKIDEYKLWKGYDCRYNHMLKTNHAALSKIVADCIQNQKPIDITDKNKFLTNVLDYELFKNTDFLEKELEMTAVKARQQYLDEAYQEPWAETSGLFDVFRKKKLK